MSKVFSRRTFMKRTALGAVGVAVAGCTPKMTSTSAPSEAGTAPDTSTTQDTGAASEIEETKYLSADASTQADVVVIGGGGAGMCAAIRARELGLKVILLEKNIDTGGTSGFTEGVCGVHSQMQKDAGIEIDDLELKLATLNYHHYRNDESVMENFYAESGKTIDWLMENGVEFALVRSLGPSYPTWHLHANTGLGYVTKLAEICDAKGVEIFKESPATHLIIEDGKISGVVYQDNTGTESIIAAPVTIVATGGYANNLEWMTDYAGINQDRCLPMGAIGRTGDGIQMGMNAGGILSANPGTVMFFGGVNKADSFGTEMFITYAFEGVLWVNEKGKRFINERFAELQFSHCGNAIIQQQRAISLVSKDYVEKMVNEGAVVGFDSRGVPPGTKLTKLNELIEKAMAEENSGVYYAETIEDLAKQLDLPEDTLRSTIEQNNADAEKGLDSQYGKDPQYLHTQEAPFYAFEMGVGYFTTVGGLKVNSSAQVLDANQEPIPGLYATGSDAGGLYGDTYDVSIAAGSQQGWAVTSGRLAAEHAASYLGK